MDWNSGPPSHWGDWGIGDASSLSCPAAGFFFSGFDPGSGCSPRSSTSTNIDFAAAPKPAPSDPAGATSAGGSVEPLMGLKLGKRTYFENPSFSSGGPIDSSSVKTKRTRGSQQGEQIPRCQVEGCNLDLASARDYHRKHRVCESHSKCPKVVVQGRECRFCQQCSRFHHISEFDQKKRSCRRRLSDHNARRRKPSPTTRLLPSPCYVADGRLQMDTFLGQSCLLTRDAGALDMNLMHAKGERIIDGKQQQQHFPVNGFRPLHNFHQLLLPFNQAPEGNIGARMCGPSSLDGAPEDLRSALSLLSNDHCGSPMDPFAQLNHGNSVAGLSSALANAGLWQMAQPSLPREDEEEEGPWARPAAKSCTRGFFIP